MNAPRPGDEEVEAVLAESRRLQREGKLDAEALRRLAARVETAGKQQEAATDAQIASMMAEMDAVLRPRQPPFRFRFTALFLMLVVVAGALLFVHQSDSFIFTIGAHYRAAAWWLFLGLLPLMAFLVGAVERRTGKLRRRYPTAAIRWLMFVVFAAFAAGAVIAAPAGWLLLYGRLAGTPVHDLEAKLVSLGDRNEKSRTCVQSGEVAWRGHVTRLCVSEPMVGPVPARGDALRLDGLQSAAGLYVLRIRKP